MEKSIAYIKAYENPFHGNGIASLFLQESAAANNPVIMDSESGSGKSTNISAIKPPKECNAVFDTAGFTLNNIADTFETHRTKFQETIARLAESLNTKQDNAEQKEVNRDLLNDIPIINMRILCIINDITAIAPYDKTILFRVMQQIQTDHNYDKEMQNGKRIFVRNSDACIIIGTTTRVLFDQILHDPIFGARANDRSTKFTVINPFKTISEMAIPNVIYDPSEYDFHLDPITHEFRPDFPIKCNTIVLENLLKPQYERNSARPQLVAKALLRAHAIFEGYDSVSMRSQLEFLQLYKPYIKYYNDWLYEDILGHSIEFDISGYSLTLDILTQRSASEEQEIERFHYRDTEDKVIRQEQEKKKWESASKGAKYKRAERLREIALRGVKKGYIQIEQNSPYQYRVSDSFQKSFIDFHEGLVK